MSFDPGVVTGVLTAAAGAIGWAIRQEGRINGHEKLFAEREKVLIAVQAQSLERHNDTKERLERIERKLDSICT